MRDPISGIDIDVSFYHEAADDAQRSGAGPEADPSWAEIAFLAALFAAQVLFLAWLDLRP